MSKSLRNLLDILDSSTTLQDPPWWCHIIRRKYKSRTQPKQELCSSSLRKVLTKLLLISIPFVPISNQLTFLFFFCSLNSLPFESKRHFILFTSLYVMKKLSVLVTFLQLGLPYIYTLRESSLVCAPFQGRQSQAFEKVLWKSLAWIYIFNSSVFFSYGNSIVRNATRSFSMLMNHFVLHKFKSLSH